MATNTTRLQLRKPDPDPSTGDFISVTTDINDNADKLDAVAGFTICTSGTRPIGAQRWDGRGILETDTRRAYVWSATVNDWLPLLLGRTANGPFLLGPSTDTATGEGINTQGSGASINLWRSRVGGDTNSRHIVSADGMHEWGSGAASVDTNLYRSAANQLKTDDTMNAADFVINTGTRSVTAELNSLNNPRRLYIAKSGHAAPHNSTSDITTWPAATKNVGSFSFNTTTGVFNVPVNGDYRLLVRAEWASPSGANAGATDIFFNIAGSNTWLSRIMSRGADGGKAVSGVWEGALTTAQNLKFQTFQNANGGASLNITINAWISYVGP